MRKKGESKKTGSAESLRECLMRRLDRLAEECEATEQYKVLEEKTKRLLRDLEAVLPPESKSILDEYDNTQIAILAFVEEFFFIMGFIDAGHSIYGLERIRKAAGTA